MRRFNAFVMLVGLGSAAVAADATLDQARRCTAVKDSLERLVCYDTLFAAQPAPPAPPAASLPAVPPAGVAAVVPAPVPAAQAPTSAKGPATGAGADAEFGDEMVRRPSRDAEDAPPRSLTATIQSLRETRPDVFRITLDNGQVWQQMDKDGLFHVAVGDTVQIDRGAMGGYRMARTSKGRSGWVRVNRVK